MGEIKDNEMLKNLRVQYGILYVHHKFWRLNSDKKM